MKKKFFVLLVVLLNIYTVAGSAFATPSATGITNTSATFVATETAGPSNEYLQTFQQEQAQDTASADQKTEQYTFSPDIPINGLFWTIGSINGKQGYWNNLGEFFEELPDPIKE